MLADGRKIDPLESMRATVKQAGETGDYKPVFVAKSEEA